MRRLLIDYWRRWKESQKTGKEIVFVPADDHMASALTKDAKIELLLAVHEVLGDLENAHPDLCPLVEMKFFFDSSDSHPFVRREAVNRDGHGASLRCARGRFDLELNFCGEALLSVRDRHHNQHTLITPLAFVG